jgi:hypothetical protein
VARIAVLGCGPAGLLAAYALERTHQNFMIFSRLDKSLIAGAQYLHIPVDGVTTEEPDFRVKFEKWGTAEEYTRKVYGDEQHPSSWVRWDEGVRLAWDLKKAYQALWDRYAEKINHVHNIGVPTVDRILEKFDLVINTLPKMAICKNEKHQFTTRVVEIEKVDPVLVPINTIIYNGLPAYFWHRASNIEGEAFREYVSGADTRVNGKQFVKPQANNCDCWRTNVIPAGRNGKWQRDVLSHEAYIETLKLFTR